MNSKKLIILIIVLSILIVIEFFLVIKPLFKEIKGFSQKIENQKESLEKLYTKGQTLGETKKIFKEIEEKIPILKNTFLLEGEELEFITTLEKIAKENEIDQKISIETKQNFKERYKFLPVSLSLKGSFENLIKYFLKIESLDFYFNIDSLTLNSFGKKDEIEITLKGKTYWAKE